MKRIFQWTALLLLAALLVGCGSGRPGAAASGASGVELFAASVGKGDALLLRVDGWTGLIDTGKASARGKVLAAMRAVGAEALDAVFITHTDGDHTGGLSWLAASEIPVGTWYASAMYTGVKPEKHGAVKAAALRGQEVQWLQRGDSVSLGKSGAALKVLAPSRRFEDKDDNNSLVMLLETSQGRMLFTGDMELPEEAELLAQGDDLSCAVLKAPNHGDDDTVSEAFARAVSADVVVISTDGQEKPGTPDPGVVARLTAAGGACYVTENAALGIRVTLKDGAARAEYVDIDEAAAEGVFIERVAPGDDLVTVRNSGAARDLTGWYLYSDRGGELYAFPDGFALEAGQAVTVGTRSSEAGTYQLLWDDKKVIHKSKADDILLYDGWGRCVDRVSNGL